MQFFILLFHNLFDSFGGREQKVEGIKKLQKHIPSN